MADNNDLDAKLNAAVTKGIDKFYNEFQSDMILYDKGDGLGKAYGRKVMGTVIIPFLVGMPILVLSWAVQWITGWDGPACFWLTIIMLLFFFFGILPRLGLKQERANALAEQRRKKAEDDADMRARGAGYLVDAESIRDKAYNNIDLS